MKNEAKKQSVLHSDIDTWLRSVDALAKDLKELAAVKERFKKKMDQIKSKYKDQVDKKPEEKPENNLEKPEDKDKEKKLNQDKIKSGRSSIGKEVESPKSNTK